MSEVRHLDPPRNGEGDRAERGGGVPPVLVASVGTVRRARSLRRSMSLPEVLLWQALRLRPGGMKFRRQFPVGRYVADFACLDARMLVEVDGAAHNRGDQPTRDARRTAALSAFGFTIWQVRSVDVLKDLDAVVAGIVARCREAGPLHQPAAGPLPRSGENLG